MTFRPRKIVAGNDKYVYCDSAKSWIIPKDSSTSKAKYSQRERIAVYLVGLERHVVLWAAPSERKQWFNKAARWEFFSISNFTILWTCVFFITIPCIQIMVFLLQRYIQVLNHSLWTFLRWNRKTKHLNLLTVIVLVDQYIRWHHQTD